MLDEGSNLILEHCKNDVIHLDEIVHSYPIDWRTKKPVIIRASDQWFINTEKIKEAAIQEVCSVFIKKKEVYTYSVPICLAIKS